MMTTPYTISTPALAAGQVGAVTLLARDLPRLEQFYRDLLGLAVIDQTASEVTLGVGGRVLLHLKNAASLPAAPVSRPGLYHTAFLLPDRADLGRWLAHAAGLGLRVGSGDHLVSEAFYLNDPEGNGIEVYADRPREGWQWQNGQVRMDTLAVDTGAVLAAAGIAPEHIGQQTQTAYTAPSDLQVGHIHLKVGNAAQAAQFYRDTLGMDIVANVPGAAFLSWGGYHHHIGLNEWHSRGQGAPAAAAAGLGGFELLVPDLNIPELSALRGNPGVTEEHDAIHLTDPWGNRVTLRRNG